MGLTAADRQWMEEIVRDVNEGWSDHDPTRPASMKFKGSDDYLRAKVRSDFPLSMWLDEP